MPGNSGVVADTKRLERILKNIPGNKHDALMAIGFSIEAIAKQNSPVDTGANRASIYVDDGSTSMPAVPANEGERVPLPRPENKDTIHVGPSMNYSLELELGSSKSAARPYLIPAVAQVTHDLEQNFKKELGKICTD